MCGNDILMFGGVRRLLSVKSIPGIGGRTPLSASGFRGQTETEGAPASSLNLFGGVPMNRVILALALAAVFIVPAVLAEDSEAASSPGTAVYYSDVGLITITFNERLPGPAEYGARFYQGHYEVPTPSAAYWSQDLVSLGNTHTVNLSDSQYSPEKPLRNLPQGTYSIEIYSVQELSDPIWIYMDISDITSLTLTDSEIYLTPGQTYQLVAVVTPASASSIPLVWSMASTAVAQISDSGLVTAVAVGDTVATVSTTDGAHSATCIVHVTGSPVASITLSTYSVTIPVGTTYTVTATVSPMTPGSTVSWSSANQAIATVSGGVITGKAVGQTDVTATYMGATATCHVTVTQGGSTVITLNPTSLSLAVGGTGKIVAIVSPTQTITWSSSDTSVAIVLEDGTVVGIGAGTAIITAKAADGTTASAVVTISGSGGGGGGGSGGGCCGGGSVWFSDILALIVVALIILIIMVLLVIVIMMLRSRDRPDWYWNGYEWRRLR